MTSPVIKSISRAMSSVNLMSLNAEEKKVFLDSFDSVITDCDGVLWHGRTPVQGAKDVMNNLKKKGKRRFYFTNNSTQTRAQFVKKLETLGFSATEDEIISTAWLVAMYLKKIGFNKKVYIVGPKSVEEELNTVGIHSFGTGADNFIPPSADSVPLSVSEMDVDMDPDVGAVVVGYDKYFSFPKIMKACGYLSRPDCLFIATNTDERFPHKTNFHVPGCGVFVAAIQTCAERKPHIMGKPSTFAIEVVLKNEVNPDRTLMIGDRFNTDIFFGNRTGMKTLLVETGVHKIKDLERVKAEEKPNLEPSFYTSSIADLLSVLNL